MGILRSVSFIVVKKWVRKILFFFLELLTIGLLYFNNEEIYCDITCQQSLIHQKTTVQNFTQQINYDFSITKIPQTHFYLLKPWRGTLLTTNHHCLSLTLSNAAVASPQINKQYLHHSSSEQFVMPEYHPGCLSNPTIYKHFLLRIQQRKTISGSGPRGTSSGIVEDTALISRRRRLESRGEEKVVAGVGE